MSQEIVNKVVEEIKKTRIFTVDYIAVKVGVEREIIEKVIGVLLAQGKLRKIKLECPCDKCIFNKICGIRRRGKNIIEYYQLVNDSISNK